MAVDGAAMQRVYNGEETQRAKMKWAREGFPETTEPQNSPSHEEEKEEDGSSEEEEDGSSQSGSSQPQDIHGHVEETPPLKQTKNRHLSHRRHQYENHPHSHKSTVDVNDRHHRHRHHNHDR